MLNNQNKEKIAALKKFHKRNGVVKYANRRDFNETSRCKKNRTEFISM